MSWNYRVMAKETPPEFKHISDDICFDIHEVYYEDDNVTPMSYSTEPSPVGGETLRDVRWQLNAMKIALTKPIIWAGAKWPQIYKEEKLTINGR